MKPRTTIIAAGIVLVALAAIVVYHDRTTYSESVTGRFELSRDIETITVDLAGAECRPGGNDFRGLDLHPGTGAVSRIRLIADPASGPIGVVSLASGEILELRRPACEVLDATLDGFESTTGGWISVDGSFTAHCTQEGSTIVTEIRFRDCS